MYDVNFSALRAFLWRESKTKFSRMRAGAPEVPIYDLRITNYDLDFSAPAARGGKAQALVMGKIKGVFL